MERGREGEGDRERERHAPPVPSPSTGSSRSAIAGSPRKPIPIEASVIPNWHAASDSSMWSSCSSTSSAPRFALFGQRLEPAAAAADERELGSDEERR